uniref:Membrane protein n=1 Tax=Tetraselmis sp. GSL018 TaxID=582737 RepID=A0A061R3X6_9CHLO|mmetsp:Transcript_11075/g.26259  ORF Transcript_11075/g.26259 Transcript_11075/m.26259 type:complete len:313 (-) Transcript_11075:387-1325(-)|eukprot:CAMPEP_0177599672 /NCGR_PEP_ID=MMETSP0419_2-20121207/13128_1 /TAXON_ID=582737 /ORGANISM="Tetraselmis sp., Strain GSL018" /LENGTH=312 /DNA_ID=CAMNT_0019092441 /DNA_START=261 /DNA_END=1199 /DNA_ORIENTATION=+
MEQKNGQESNSRGRPTFAVSSTLFDEKAVAPVSTRTVWTLRILNTLASVAVFVVNGLGSSGFIAGRSQGDVSGRYPNPITPAGYAFSIWGLIYFFHAAFLVYQWLPTVNKGLVFGRVAYWNIALCAGNITWIFVFSYELLEVSAAVIWYMLVCLATIYFRIHTHKGLSALDVKNRRTWLEYFCVYVPWSLYTCWLVGASLVNTFLATRQRPEDLVYGGIGALTSAAFIVVLVLCWTRDVWFAGVNVWTLVAIGLRQETYVAIWSVSFSLAGLVGAFAVLIWGINVYDLFAKQDEDENETTAANQGNFIRSVV